jgi:hypothetical protein
MNGYIRLDDRDYRLVTDTAINRTMANQMAAKVTSGDGSYDDQQAWSFLVQTDWRTGVGKDDAEAMGSFYSEADTRFRHLSNPVAPLLATKHEVLAASNGLQPGIGLAGGSDRGVVDGEITIGDSQTYTKIAKKIVVPSGYTFQYAFIYIANDPTKNYDRNADTYPELSVTVDIMDNNSGVPNSVVRTATIVPLSQPGYTVYMASFSAITSSGDNTYYIVVYPSAGTLTLPRNSTDEADFADGLSFHSSNGWQSTDVPFFFAHWVTNYASGGGDVFVTSFGSNGDEVYYNRLTAIYHYDIEDTNPDVTLVTSFATSITDLVTVGDNIYIGQGNSLNYYIMDNFESTSDGGSAGRLFALWRGYLYKAVDNDVYYSSDGSTWSNAIQVCFPGFQIRGMAGLGDSLYISCDDGLYRLAPGDIVEAVCRWGTISSSNGEYMLHYQGNIYISLNKALIKFDGANFLPFGVDLGEGLPEGRLGNIGGLATTNNWILCAIAADDTLYPSTVWAHNGQGWHYLMSLPPGMLPKALHYQSRTNNLFVATDKNIVWSLKLSDAAASPFDKHSGIAKYADIYAMPHGWVELPRYYGSLREVQKDWESVYIEGENLDSEIFVKVYWKDDDSTYWELLGTFDNGREEIRWSDPATRPNSRSIRIGLAIFSRKLNPLTPVGATTTPIVTAFRVKHQPMVIDRFRWNLAIEVADDQLLLDSSVNPYTASQMVEHLDTLLNQVPPFVFADEGEQEYEVKVVSGNRRPSKIQWLPGLEQRQVWWTYDLILEQVTAGEYDPD